MENLGFGSAMDFVMNGVGGPYVAPLNAYAPPTAPTYPPAPPTRPTSQPRAQSSAAPRFGGLPPPSLFDNPLGNPLVQEFLQPKANMMRPVDMRQHGAFYNRELADPDLSKVLGAHMGMAQQDEAKRGGFYQPGDLNDFFKPNWNDPREVRQFAQMYDKGNPYFVTDTLDVNPGFAAYHNQKAQDALVNVTPEQMAQTRADQDALHTRLSQGQRIAGRMDINDAREVDNTMRGLLDAQSKRVKNPSHFTQQALRAGGLLAGADVSQGRLTVEQGDAIRVASGDAASVEGLRSHTNLMDEQIANAQKALAEYQWDNTKSKKWNESNLASLRATVDGFNSDKARSQQQIGQFNEKLAPYAQALAGVTDLSGLSSADVIRSITGRG